MDVGAGVDCFFLLSDWLRLLSNSRVSGDRFSILRSEPFRVKISAYGYRESPTERFREA